MTESHRKRCVTGTGAITRKRAWGSFGGRKHGAVSSGMVVFVEITERSKEEQVDSP